MLRGFDAFIETEVPHEELIISRTDLSGTITYANETFARISGYKKEELVGKSHRILRHKDMPKSVFKELWETIQTGQMWEGVIKNRRKDGGYYWVRAQISGVYKNDTLVEYKSMRSPISAEEKIHYQRLYDEKKEKEEDECRIVAYLPCALVEKVKSYARQTEQDPEKALAALCFREA
jgi:aerotaxis receptor